MITLITSVTTYCLLIPWINALTTKMQEDVSPTCLEGMIIFCLLFFVFPLLSFIFYHLISWCDHKSCDMSHKWYTSLLLSLNQLRTLKFKLLIVQDCPMWSVRITQRSARTRHHWFCEPLPRYVRRWGITASQLPPLGWNWIRTAV